jgi:cytochrome c oxidase cbb3-type subunit 3
MSDFLHDGWSIFIAVTTIVSILACLALLIIAARRRQMSDDNSTGHVFDGDLVEMNNPLPRWWMGLFVLTIVFALGYVVVYPALGSYKGLLGWSSSGTLQAEQDMAEAESAKVYAAYAVQPAELLAGDASAMATGQRLFLNNCATCHGSDAKGSKGFPNLTDKDWLHGGSPEKIEETIREGRIGNMPPMGAAVGGAQDLHGVAQYVLSLSNGASDSVAVASSRAKFTVCASCHGIDGKGNTALGAPNLADDVWLHGWGEAAIVEIVTQGKRNVMPPQKDRLTAAQIHLLASYVWSLSHPRAVAVR